MILTVELHSPVAHILEEVTTTWLLDSVALSLCLTKSGLEDEVQWRGDDREDNRPAAQTPSPTNLVVELVGDLGTSECGDDVGRGSEGKRQTSVLQFGSIGGDDINGILHTTEADIVEDLGLLV
jgi:hypothetical protein